MKSEKEIRDMIDELINRAVACSDEYAEETFIEKAHLLGWVIGFDSREIDNQFEKLMEKTYCKGD